VNDEDRPLLRGQPPKPTLKQIAVHEQSGPVRDRRALKDERPDLDELAGALVTGCSVASMDEETTHPRFEPIGIMQPREPEPGSKERVLDRVLGPVVAAEDQPGRRKEAVDRAGDEQREGVVVTASSPIDQVPIHCPALLSRPGGRLSLHMSLAP
jgi:hypothetical protein